MRIDEKTMLADIVRQNAAALPLIMRFGFRPGFGKLRVGVACAQSGIDTGLFLRVVRAAVDPSFDTEYDVNDSLPPVTDRGQLVEFLQRSNEWYLETQLPNIGRHFDLLIKRSPGETSKGLAALHGFYDQLASELRERDRFDREVLFPVLRAESPAEETGEESLRSLLAESEELDSGLEDEAEDLLTFLLVHLQGDIDPNLLTAVVWAVDNLRKDLMRNSSIRRSCSRILKTTE
ncbi:MAG: hypothetical protein HDS14_05060 [Bacteroides sp.]|nr:hypothetical protein [Bacteroides sp.]